MRERTSPRAALRRCGSLLAVALLVEARTRDLEQSRHAVDFEVRALRFHQSEPLRFGGFAAKYAAAFFKNSLSFSCSATWRRSRTSSARSVALSGSSLVPSSASRRRRSSRTHRNSEFSATEISLATSVTLRPESMTRCAASILNSSVNFLLVGAMVTSSQPAQRTGLSGVHFLWGISKRYYAQHAPIRIAQAKDRHRAVRAHRMTLVEAVARGQHCDICARTYDEAAVLQTTTAAARGTRDVGLVLIALRDGSNSLGMLVRAAVSDATFSDALASRDLVWRCRPCNVSAVRRQAAGPSLSAAIVGACTPGATPQQVYTRVVVAYPTTTPASVTTTMAELAKRGVLIRQSHGHYCRPE